MNVATETIAAVEPGTVQTQDPGKRRGGSVGDSGEFRGSLGRRGKFVRSVALTVFVLALGLLLHMLLIGRIQHSASQQRLRDQFRGDLAQGTAPVSGLDQDGRPVKSGTPVALLEIERLGVREVVVEGTAAGDLVRGPGHRRDTVLPGQSGTSVLQGRRSLFGGPFASFESLQSGDEIRVTTGQGAFRFLVRGLRRAGDPLPRPVKRGEARLVLITASGSRLIPTGALYVDAELDGSAVSPGPIAVTALPGEEREFSGDTRSLAELALWLQGLLIVVAAALWSWRRWGKLQTWVVFAPVLLLVGVRAGGELLTLIPNLV